MIDFDWELFLRQWGFEVLNSDKYIDEIGNLAKPSAQLLTTGWLGYTGATEIQLQHTEERLGVALPPSYRTFLATTNGWGQLTNYVYKIFPTEDVNWLAERDTGWADAYDGVEFEPVSDEDYLSYRDEGFIRPEYIKTALQISEIGDAAVYVLNPKIVNAEGEWEAWFLASWNAMIPVRYPSFLDLMLNQYKNYVEYNIYKKLN